MNLHIVHLIFMVIFMASRSHANDDDKPWPDFSCLQNFHKPAKQKDNMKWTKLLWDQCKEDAEDKGKDSCVKACMLGAHAMFNHNPSDGSKNGSEEDIDTFMKLLARKNGYEKGAGGEPAKKIMDKVREGMKKCVKDHPELKTLDIDDPCVKWDPFLSCVNNVLGC